MRLAIPTFGVSGLTIDLFLTPQISEDEALCISSHSPFTFTRVALFDITCPLSFITQSYLIVKGHVRSPTPIEKTRL